MAQIKANRCREKTSRPNSTKLNIIHSKPVLGKLISTLFSLLPTLFISCTHEYNTIQDGSSITVELKSIEPLRMSDHIDLFTFNDNSLMQIDSYQRVEGTSNGRVNLRSQNGEKKSLLIGTLQAEYLIGIIFDLIGDLKTYIQN